MEIRIFRYAERIRLRILHRLSRADFYLELIPFVIEPKRLATPLSGFALSNRLHLFRVFFKGFLKQRRLRRAECPAGPGSSIKFIIRAID